jgi:Mg2+ and Co2+ transporter CorA
MQGKLTHVLDRFASQRTQIERELLKNPQFRSLCEDYGETAETLNHWKQSIEPKARVMMKEYRQLLEDLEQEILAHLG